MRYAMTVAGLLPLLVAGCSLPGAGGGEPTNPVPLELNGALGREIAGAEAGWSRAALRRDSVALAGIWADGFSQTVAWRDGGVNRRQAFIGELRMQADTARFEPTAVDAVGRDVLVSGLMTVETRADRMLALLSRTVPPAHAADERPDWAVVRVVERWTKTGGAWRVVTSRIDGSETLATRLAATSTLTILAAQVQQFYRRPVQLGGGGNSFVGLTTGGIGIDTSAAGPVAYRIDHASAERAVVIATFRDDMNRDGKFGDRMSITVLPGSVGDAGPILPGALSAPPPTPATTGVR